MEAGHSSQPFQRLFLLKALPNGAQDRHFALGPFNAALAGIGKAEVLDIVSRRRDRHFRQCLRRRSGESHKVAFPK